MRMQQSSINDIVAKRNRRLFEKSTKGWSRSAKNRVSANAQLNAALGPASPETVELVNKALTAQTRMMRSGGLTR